VKIEIKYFPSSQSEREGEAPSGFAGGGGDASPYNRLRIAYTDQGKGTPVVFLHAFPLSKAMWEPQIKDLSQSCRVIAPDLRGHGESDAPLWRYTIEMFADDIRGLLDHLSIQQAVLAGLSMGGYIAFAFYRKYRDRVKGLILADTRPQADTSERRQERFNAAQMAHQKGAGAIAEMMIPKLFSSSSLKERPDRVKAVRDIITRTPVAGITGDLMAMAERPDSVPLLSEIACPTLILVGEDDVLTPPTDARFMAETIRKARLEMIPGAGHLSNLENPEAFNSAVRKFVRVIDS
jgi:3-oxoadipate enol-lactonase